MGGGQSATARNIEEQAKTQSGRLDKLVLGNLDFLFNNLSTKFGTDWNRIPGEVAAGFDKVRQKTEDEYASAQFGASEASRYLARTSGSPISGGEVRHRLAEDALRLDQDRRFTLGQINLEEANAGLSANNALMRLFTGGGQTALGLASSYQQQAIQAASQINTQDPWMGALGGAASGAAMGAQFGGWGAIPGAIIGGVAGYYGGR